MQRNTLLAGTAIALIMCAVPALAQQRNEEKSSPAQTQGESKEQGKQQKGTSESKTAPKEKSAQGAASSESKEKGAQTHEKGQKGTAQGSGKDQDHKSSQRTESREKEGKGTAQSPAKDKDKGTAQAPARDKDKGTAQAPGKEQDKMGSKQAEPKDRAGKDSAQQQSKEGGAQKSTERQGSGGRVQLSEQQRTNVHETLLKESNLNRASNVNISISVGTRIPRSVRLAPLPVSIISVVPDFRSYQYVAVNDEICIVDPNSYEIVEVIAAPGGRTARLDSQQGPATLVLTEEEKTIVLQSVDTDRSSTLGLGTLTEGSAVPRGAKVQPFSDTVVQKVPKLKGHKFFAAEDRIAIVDNQGDKVQLVLEGKR
jgi:hypothetical protein